jgi:hypothetical protein
VISSGPTRECGRNDRGWVIAVENLTRRSALAHSVHLRIGVEKVLRCIIASMILSRNPVLATTIFVVRTSDGVVIAADSKINIKGNSPRSFTACKIHRFGDVYFAAAGLYANATAGLDVIAIAEQASRSMGTLNDKVQAFDDLIHNRVTLAIADIRVNDPAYYKDLISSTLVLLTRA